MLDEAATRRKTVKEVPPKPLIRRSRLAEALGREGVSQLGDGCLPRHSRQKASSRLNNRPRSPSRLLPTVVQRADRSSVARTEYNRRVDAGGGPGPAAPF